MFLDFLPSYVETRGPAAIAAYQRAKESGTTVDRRVKVLVIGQDRVGKTSVVRSLKGEHFRSNETSTDGVQMHEPLKNPGTKPWKSATTQRDTVYHHKCAEWIGREIGENLFRRHYLINVTTSFYPFSAKLCFTLSQNLECRVLDEQDYGERIKTTAAPAVWRMRGT